MLDPPHVDGGGQEAGDGEREKPAVRTLESSWLWQRYGMHIGGKAYGHGVSVHVPSSVTIDLNRECTAYDALPGIDDMTRGLGQVRFSVYGDGARLWQSPMVRGGQPAVPVHVPLAGKRAHRRRLGPVQDQLPLRGERAPYAVRPVTVPGALSLP